MDTEHVVCPYCRTDIREAGVVKVETGLTQHNLYHYHPYAQQFMEEDLSRRDQGAATTWQCRSCKRDLTGEIVAYIETHIERW
jgi:hypothetical protein